MTSIFKAKKVTYGELLGLNSVPKEKWGPDGYRKFAHIGRPSNTEVITFPHIDKFKTLRDVYSLSQIQDRGGIVLSGSTGQYTVDNYGNDDIVSLSQYFLQHKTRDGIQYLIFVDTTAIEENRFKAFIPGLLYSADGTVLGYIPSYVADNNGNITIEIPYGENINNYNVSGATLISKINNIITVYITTQTNVTLSYNGREVNLTLYKQSSGTKEFTVKEINNYGDYTIAAQLAENNNIKNVISLLSKLEERSITLPPKSSGGSPETITTYFPGTFISLLNYKPSEEVANVTPGFYKVPAAFVPTDNDNEKVFMTDVLGASANTLARFLE